MPGPIENEASRGAWVRHLDPICLGVVGPTPEYVRGEVVALNGIGDGRRPPVAGDRHKRIATEHRSDDNIWVVLECPPKIQSVLPTGLSHDKNWSQEPSHLVLPSADAASAGEDHGVYTLATPGAPI